MKKILILIIMVIFMTSCAPSESVIQTAIGETQAAIPTNTMPSPTKTPLPTNTPTVIPTKEYCNIDEVLDAREQLLPPLSKLIETLDIAEKVKSPLEFKPLQSDLTKIKNDIQKIYYPPCLEDAKVYLEETITELNNGLVEAIDNNYNSGIKKITLASEYIVLPINEIQKIIDCLPN